MTGGADPITTTALVIAGLAIKAGMESWKGDTHAVPVSALTGERKLDADICC